MNVCKVASRIRLPSPFMGFRWSVVCNSILGTRRPLSQYMGGRWSVICNLICNRVSCLISVFCGDIWSLVADGR